MENLIIYIAKASGLMAMFALAYYAFLRKETFFNTNRWYLLAGLVTSAVLPLVVYTKVIWIDPAPAQQLQEVSLNHLVMLHQAQQAAQETGIYR
jgi:Tfp pilus assembly protein PilZ